MHKWFSHGCSTHLLAVDDKEVDAAQGVTYTRSVTSHATPQRVLPTCQWVLPDGLVNSDVPAERQPCGRPAGIRDLCIFHEPKPDPAARALLATDELEAAERLDQEFTRAFKDEVKVQNADR